MDLLTYFIEFAYPSCIVASYVAITLIKRYTSINKKYHLLISIFVGIFVSLIEHFSFTLDVVATQKIIAGALSGLIASTSYSYINKIISNKK